MQEQVSRRLDGYVRVSDVGKRKGASFISPDVQRERIDGWARLQGHEIIKVHEELDVSGGTTDRPMLNEVMRRIEAGETEGVVVAKLDRFGRTLIGSLELIKRIGEKEALFASVAEGFDITTPSGRLVLNMMLSIAQWELERIRDNWVDSRGRAIKRGVHLSSVPPFGYLWRDDRPREVRAEDGGLDEGHRLKIDPKTGPIVTELFERRAMGQSYNALRAWLLEIGCPTPLGKEGAWATSTMLDVLRRRVYLGEVSDPVSGEVNPDGHPPLVDAATFQAVQGRRGVRAGALGTQTLLRGLVRCAGCRYSMAGKRKGTDGEDFYYACQRSGVENDCPAPANIKAGDFRRGNGDTRLSEDFERHGEDALASILAGGSGRAAERRCGMPRNTIDRWLHIGLAQPDSIFGPFAQRVDELWSETKPWRHNRDGGKQPWAKYDDWGTRVGLHDYVVERMFERLPELEYKLGFGTDDGVDGLDAKLKAAKAELAGYLGDRKLENAAGREAYLTGAESRRQRVESAQAELDEAMRRAGSLTPEIHNLREDWETMTLDEQRDALQALVQAVFVRQVPEDAARGKGASAARVHIVWADEALVDLPRQGRRDFVSRAFVFPGDAD
jgi:DNA invertase Pin-like site-specific DNA recombinase